MADDVTLPGAGAVVATDDDGARHWQLVKLAWGPLNTFNLVDVASGKPLPIQLRDASGNALLGQTAMAAAIPVVVASDQSLLQVGANTKVTLVTPTVSASPDYAVDDNLGGKITIPALTRANDKGGVINFVAVTCDVDIPAGVTIDVVFFGADPSASTFTDNSAIAINVADLHHIIGVAQLNTRMDFGTPAALVEASPRGIPFMPVSGTDDIYAVMIVRGAATLNLAATTDINLIVGVLED